MARLAPAGDAQGNVAQDGRAVVAETQVAELDFAAQHGVGGDGEVGVAVVDGRLLFE